jgi:hypothetical protein
LEGVVAFLGAAGGLVVSPGEREEDVGCVGGAFVVFFDPEEVDDAEAVLPLLLVAAGVLLELVVADDGGEVPVLEVEERVAGGSPALWEGFLEAAGADVLALAPWPAVAAVGELEEGEDVVEGVGLVVPPAAAGFPSGEVAVFAEAGEEADEVLVPEPAFVEGDAAGFVEREVGARGDGTLAGLGEAEDVLGV